MPNVEFNEEKEYTDSLAREGGARYSRFARLVIRLGLAKDETGANIVLVGLAVLVVVLAAALFFSAS
ncbi:MAG: hypothetical protein Greene041679_252 [Parcubacteria group bacterium Greene0416_79]|nr:MAG: hypothetical protein Greene041679_252 [Parcubacteria group bacterium Greene0416_79]